MLWIIILPVIVLTVITFLGIWAYDIRDEYKQLGTFDYSKQPIIKNSLLSALFVFGSLLIVNSEFVYGLYNMLDWLLWIVAGIISLSISWLWFKHINKLDIYEPEKYQYLFAIFGIGAICSFGVFPLSEIFTSFFIEDFNGEFTNDLIFSIMGIGMIEEFVKILPVLLLARFTKILNEPFDYLLFCTMSALGFAFVENAMYLERSGLNAIDGRALFASPAHMILSSYIGYQWAISIFRSNKSTMWAIIWAYLVSSIAHGLYDFWLISSSANFLSILSVLILLLGLKIWVRLANNLINISNFFNEEVRFNAREFKYELAVYLIGILSITYVAKSVLYNSDAANELLFRSVFVYSFLMAYIGINFSNIVIIKDYVAPLLNDFSFSLAMFLPLGINKPSCNGRRIKIYVTDHMRITGLGKSLVQKLPVKGKLVRRIVVENDVSFYVFKPDVPIYLPGFYTDELILTTLDSDRPLCAKKSVMATVYAVEEESHLANPIVEPYHLIHIQNVRSKGIVTRKSYEQ